MVTFRPRSGGLEAYREKVRNTNRKAILNAARNLFLQSGFNRVCMADVAQQAQVSTATLYKYFRSKNDLFVSMVEQTYAEIAGTLTAKTENLPIEDILLGMGEELAATHYEGGLNALMRAVVTEVANNPQLGRDFLRLSSTLRQNFAINYLDKLVASGKLDIPDTSLAALQIRGAFKEIYIWPALLDPDYRPSAADLARLRAAIRLILRCYRPKSDHTAAICHKEKSDGSKKIGR